MAKKKLRIQFYQHLWDTFYTGDRNYYQETVKKMRRLPHLEGDVDVDICIIGAGFTGLATAYFLKDSGLKTVIIERHEIGWGSSGRNGGQILPGYAPDIGVIRRKFGDDAAQTLWKLSLEGVDIVKTICREHNIDCDLKPGAVYLAENLEEDSKLQTEAEMLKKNYAYHVDHLDAAHIAEMMGTDFYHSGIYKADAAHFHPVKYIRALSQIVQKQGVQIFESTPAEGVHDDGDGYVVYTPNGRIRARRVVFCGDSHLGTLVPQLRRKYVLIRNAIIGTEQLSPDMKVIPSDVCAYEVSQFMHFYRKAADGTFLIGGGDNIKPGITTAATQHKIITSLHTEMGYIFPQIKDVEVKYQWGGYIGVTNTFLPNVGTIDDDIFYANGFSGHGINVTHVVGRILADGLAGRSDEYKVFKDINNLSFPELVYWDSRWAYAGMQLYALKNEVRHWRHKILSRSSWE